MIGVETFTVYNCLIALMSSSPEQVWQGTASQLLDALTPLAGRWTWAKLPRNGRSLVVEINKVQHLAHLTIEYQRMGKQRTRIIRIQKDASFPPPLFTFSNVFN